MTELLASKETMSIARVGVSAISTRRSALATEESALVSTNLICDEVDLRMSTSGLRPVKAAICWVRGERGRGRSYRGGTEEGNTAGDHAAKVVAHKGVGAPPHTEGRERCTNNVQLVNNECAAYLSVCTCR